MTKRKSSDEDSHSNHTIDLAIQIQSIALVGFLVYLILIRSILVNDQSRLERESHEICGDCCE